MAQRWGEWESGGAMPAANDWRSARAAVRMRRTINRATIPLIPLRSSRLRAFASNFLPRPYRRHSREGGNTRLAAGLRGQVPQSGRGRLARGGRFCVLRISRARRRKASAPPVGVEWTAR